MLLPEGVMRPLPQTADPDPYDGVWTRARALSAAEGVRAAFEAARRAKAEAKKFNPDQPRDPAGTTTGGQWTARNTPTRAQRNETIRGMALDEALVERLAARTEAGQITQDEGHAIAEAYPINAPYKEQLAFVEKHISKADMPEILEIAEGKLARYDRYFRTLVSQAHQIRGGKDYYTFFHGTTKEAAEAIKKEGLIPKKSEGADVYADKHPELGSFHTSLDGREASVYFTPEPIMAKTFAEWVSENTATTPTIVEIRIPPDHIKEVLLDERAPDGGLRFNGPIPREWVADVFHEEGHWVEVKPVKPKRTKFKKPKAEGKAAEGEGITVYLIIPCVAAEAKYAPDQPRDYHGRWTSGSAAQEEHIDWDVLRRGLDRDDAREASKKKLKGFIFDVAQKRGIDPFRISVIDEENAPVFKLGDKLYSQDGVYNRETGNISITHRADWTEDKMGPILAHEITHAQYHAVAKAIEAGDEVGEAFKKFKPKDLKLAGGVTEYSNRFWEQQGRLLPHLFSMKKGDKAINETLADIAAIRDAATRKSPEARYKNRTVPPLLNELYDTLQEQYGKLKDRGWFKTFDPLQPRDYRGRWTDGSPGVVEQLQELQTRKEDEVSIRSRVLAAADWQEFPKEDIEFTDEDYKFELNGKMHSAAGTADTKTGKIKMYMKQLTPDNCTEVAIHEIEHIRYQTVLNAASREHDAMMKDKEVWAPKPGGHGRLGGSTGYAGIEPTDKLRPWAAERYPIWDRFQKYDGKWSTFQRLADGSVGAPISSYAAEWWKDPHAMTLNQMHESVAEIARIKSKSPNKKFEKLWEDYYNDVEWTFKKLQREGRAKL